MPVQERLRKSCRALGFSPLSFTLFNEVCHWIDQNGVPVLKPLGTLAAQPSAPPSNTEPDLVEKTENLKKNPLFQGLKIRELMSIARGCRVRVCCPGEVIFQEGQAAQGVYFFVPGQA